MKQRLVELPVDGKVIFVGDTHGDTEASEAVIENYLKPHHKIVFLGDYVDHRLDSKGNIDYLLKMQRDNPEQIYLLLGNHEAFPIVGCKPCDFWDSLKSDERAYYAKEFSALPLAVSVGSIIALHGALPYVDSLDEINKIEDADTDWMAAIWGDFQEIDGGYAGTNSQGRPQFGRNHFEDIMSKLNKGILIRSHQSNAQRMMYNDRCLTIFTSSAYKRKREIAIADSKKDIKSIDDIIIKEI